VLDPSVGGKGETPFSVSGGVLKITTKATSPTLSGVVNQPYTTGYLDTHRVFSQKYGYFEMRAKMSGAVGSQSAFWLLPFNMWPPEIDIIEVDGVDPHHQQYTNHYGTRGATAFLDVWNGPDVSAGFHTYGLMWDTKNITWYRDGIQQLKTATQPDEHQPFYMILSLYAYDGTQGNVVPPNPATFLGQYSVDWVRVYSKDVAAVKIAGQPGYQDHDGSCSVGGPAQPNRMDTSNNPVSVGR
jgi:beta-glucanase (GH16 family)